MSFDHLLESGLKTGSSSLSTALKFYLTFGSVLFSLQVYIIQDRIHEVKNGLEKEKFGVKESVEIWTVKIDQLRGTRRNSHVFKEMKEELEAHKCFVFAEDIKVSINNLFYKYR